MWRSPSLTVQDIVDPATGRTIDPTAVRGTVRPVVGVTLPEPLEEPVVVLRAGSRTVAPVPVAHRRGHGTVAVDFPTDARDAAGARVYPSGDVTVSAVLFAAVAAGVPPVQQSSITRQLTLANP